MNPILSLMKPRFWSFRRLIKRAGSGKALKTAILGSIGIVFWLGIFLVSLKVIRHLRTIEELGDLLAFKLLSMMFVIFFSLLIFSGILTFLSKLYLSRDLFLVHSMPVDRYRIYIARWIEGTMDSSWMVFLFSLPILIAYGVAFTMNGWFYMVSALSIIGLSVIAAGISAIGVMAAVMIVPANRMRTVFIFLGFSLFLVLFVAFRIARPERLVDPESFSTALVYLEALNRPSSVFLPSSWAYDAIKSVLAHKPASAVFHLMLLFTGSGFFFCLSAIVAQAIYFEGFTRAQTALVRKRPKRSRNMPGLNFFRGPRRAFLVKEILTFLRDQTQWSQLFLIAALIVIYLYNFKVLPIEKAPIRTIYLQNLLSFLNMGLAAFVLVSVSARFTFTAVSMEKDAFWLVKTSPVSMKSFLWIKFGIYVVPLWVMTEILIVATNLLLRVTPFMMILSALTMCVMVPVITALSIGMGAAYPDFHSENIAQTVTSFGGLFFMILSAGYVAAVILLEAGPVYTIFMAQFRGTPIGLWSRLWIAGAFVLALLVSILTFAGSMAFGIRRLEKAMEGN